MPASTVSGAALVSQRLLGTAGVAGEWSICDSGACHANALAHVLVILRSQDARQTAVCGWAARAEHDLAGTIIVSVPCVARVAFELSRSAAFRRHPLLAMLRHDDYVGLVIAHEIAHVLGVGHARAGVMRPELLTEDLLALRAGTLEFDPHEAAQLRSGLASVTTSLPQTAVARLGGPATPVEEATTARVLPTLRHQTGDSLRLPQEEVRFSPVAAPRRHTRPEKERTP